MTVLQSPFHQHLEGSFVMSMAHVDSRTEALVREQCRLAQEALRQNHRSEAITRLHYAELLLTSSGQSAIVGMSAALRLREYEDGTR